MEKIGLLFINPYYGTSYELGKAVENDGELFENELKRRGYKVRKYLDSSAREFIREVREESERRNGKLVIYYSGHGISIHDRDGDEEDGRDEAFVFRDGYVLDDVAEKLVRNNKCGEVVLISDCCHSGTIWDEGIEGNVCSISACGDNETAKQTRFTIHTKKSISHGVLTYYFWKYHDRCGGDLRKIIEKINPLMKKYSQRAVVRGSSENRL